MYIIHQPNGNVIECAYKEEVIEWIMTGTFEYNEDLTINTLYVGRICFEDLLLGD